jgi:hypothetical protein
MNGAPRNSPDMLRADSDRMKKMKVCVKSFGPIRPLTPLMPLTTLCRVGRCFF